MKKLLFLTIKIVGVGHFHGNPENRQKAKFEEDSGEKYFPPFTKKAFAIGRLQFFVLNSIGLPKQGIH
jgi:hypothetical protein